MRKWMLILFMVFAFQNAFSQEFEMIRHQVQMGETIRMISRKYKVEPSEIYRLNKFAIDGISKGMVLQIMAPKKEEKVAETLPPPETSEDTVVQNTHAITEDSSEKTVTSTQTTTTVRKKKQNQEPVAEAEKPVVVEQTQPSDNNPPQTATSSENTGQEVKHTVAKGETLFSLSRKYGVKVDDIKNQNADVLKKGLQPGQVLTINASQVAEVSSVPETTVVKEVKSEPEVKAVTQTETQATDNLGQELKHTVSKGETLFSLSKRYNVTVDDIKNQNVDLLKKGLQVGQVLTIMAKN